jgi:hypothetical protein
MRASLERCAINAKSRRRLHTNIFTCQQKARNRCYRYYTVLHISWISVTQPSCQHQINWTIPTDVLYNVRILSTNKQLEIACISMIGQSISSALCSPSKHYSALTQPLASSFINLPVYLPPNLHIISTMSPTQIMYTFIISLALLVTACYLRPQPCPRCCSLHLLPTLRSILPLPCARSPQLRHTFPMRRCPLYPRRLPLYQNRLLGRYAAASKDDGNWGL